MAHNIIRRIKVTGGFLDGIDLNFAPGLNCVIGERGTGKTTLLEFIDWPCRQNQDRSKGGA